MRFRDRRDAGRRLAEALARRYGEVDGIVYALPRGGVVLGAEIAARLGAPLDLIIARKLGHPHNPEYAIGAVTEDGEVVANPRETAALPRDWLERRIESERQEAQRRHAVYLGGRPRFSPAGKTAIVVDDGIATGLTMQAAIRALQRQDPARIVVAVPVVPPDTAARLEREVDDLVALDIPDDYLGAVGAYYDEFPQVSDSEVVALLREAERAPPRR